MWPPLKLADLVGTKAYDHLQESHLMRRKKKPREAVGDFLGGPAAADYGPHLPEEVYACFNSVIQGDHLGVEIATQSHKNMLKSRGLLCGEEELTSTFPFAGRQVVQGLIIDDFFSVSVEDLSSGRTSSLSEKRFKVAQQAYESEGLIGSKEKDVIDQDCAKVAGAELDCSSHTRSLGLCTVAAPAGKRLGLSFLSLQLASLRATTDALHACLAGGWTSCLMYRRPLMSILDKVHSFADLSSVDQSDPQVLRLPSLVAQEFVLLGILAPLICTDISTKFSPSIFATDASDLKGAIVKAEVDNDLARGLWRTGRKKGGYTRLLTREQALLSKIDAQWEEEAPEEPAPRPGKPLALRNPSLSFYRSLWRSRERSQSSLIKKA